MSKSGSVSSGSGNSVSGSTSSESSSTTSSSDSSSTTSDSLSGSPTTAESLANSPTTADTLSGTETTTDSTTETQTVDSDLERVQNAGQMAEFSKDAYLDFDEAAGPNALESGTQRLNPDQLPSELGLNKSDLVDDKSGYHAAVYQRGLGDDASYVVAFRGTENMTDWVTNAGSTIGAQTTQFSRADDLVRTLALNVGAENIEVTGHSLGGGLANYAGMKNEVHSTAFNPKGTTWRENMQINEMDARAEQYVHNYQVKGEVLTGAQETADALTVLPSVGIQDLLKPAPGPTTEIPAIRADGTESNMFLEVAKEGLMRISPFHDGADHDISGPVDRHGMDYVLRGMDELTESTRANAD